MALDERLFYDELSRNPGNGILKTLITHFRHGDKILHFAWKNIRSPVH